MRIKLLKLQWNCQLIMPTDHVNGQAWIVISSGFQSRLKLTTAHNNMEQNMKNSILLHPE